MENNLLNGDLLNKKLTFNRNNKRLQVLYLKFSFSMLDVTEFVLDVTGFVFDITVFEVLH